MKNLSIAVAVTALIAFSLGYYTRGALERASNIPNDTEQIAVIENTKVTAPQSTVRAELNHESVQTAAGFDQEAIKSTRDAAHRESRARLKRDRLEDFFFINGIGADRAEQIVQGLIEADYYLGQIQRTMFDRRTAEKAELIARGDEVAISLTPEERAAFEAVSNSFTVRAARKTS
jgi:hypothetical protein